LFGLRQHSAFLLLLDPSPEKAQKLTLCWILYVQVRQSPDAGDPIITWDALWL
jgi:hypothetical protein